MITNKPDDEDLPLTKMYNSLQAGGMSRRFFEESVFRYIFDNIRKYKIRFRNKDDCVDFICSLYPKLSNAIDNYQVTGHSFDAYIAATIRYSFQSECCREKTKSIIETACWKSRETDAQMQNFDGQMQDFDGQMQDFDGRQTRDSGGRQIPDEGGRQTRDSGGRQIPDAGGRQIPDAGGPIRADAIRHALRDPKTKAGKKHSLILLLKGYHLAEDSDIKTVSEITNLPEETICALLRRMREIREHAESRFQKMKEHAYTQYYRCLAYESRLRALDEKPYHYQNLEARYEHARQTLHNMRRRLSRVKRAATNRQIAELLGIPKGTVDSCFVSLRKRVCPPSAK